MTANYDHTDPDIIATDKHVDLEAIAADVDDARLVYGAVLVNNQLSIIECIDFKSYEDIDISADIAMLAALGGTRKQMGDYIDRTEDNHKSDLGKIAAKHLDTGPGPLRVTDFNCAATLIPNASVCYLLLNIGGTYQWNRIQDVYPDQFTDHDPLAGILVVAYTLVDEARERIRQQPLYVRTKLNEHVEEIDWGT